MDVRKITIRKFRPQDGEAVSNIIRDNLIKINSKDYSQSVIDYMCELYTPTYLRQISNKRKIYVAINNEVVVGTASIDNDTIYTVFVDTQYHRKGIAKKLINLFEEIVDNNGIRLLKVQASITSQKFYEKLGYSKVGEEESDQYGKSIIMEKYLV